MNKFIKNILIFSLCSIMIYGIFAGCSKKDGTNSDESGTIDNIPSNEEEIKFSDTIMLKDGKSDYKLIIPENPTFNENIAVSEFNNFMEQSTGVKLAVLKDKEVILTANSKFISIGDTELIKDGRVKVDKEHLINDGFLLKTKYDTIYAIGGNDTGTLNAVYELLNILVGFEAFAQDEYYVENKTEIRLPILNKEEIPHFKYRVPGHYQVNHDVELARRMRVHNAREPWGGGLSSHSNFKILPKDQYYEMHPDWYSDDEGHSQLCLTRSVGDLSKNAVPGTMRYEYVQNLKNIVENSPEGQNYMLSAQDFDVTCHCEKCRESDAKYGGPSGTNMRFVNAVAREMNEWLKKEHPERKDVKFVTFAYLQTFDAPVVKNGDKVEPVDESVIAEDNVGVMFAPIDMAFNYDIEDEVNKRYADSMKDWQCISDSLFVWNYCFYSNNMFAYFDNTASMQKNYKFYHENKVISLFDQAGIDHGDQPTFNELLTYQQAHLMWDSNADLKALTDHFMEHYYGIISPYMKEYYENLNLLYREYEETYLIRNNNEKKWELKILEHLCDDGENIYRKEFWNKEFLISNLELLDEAVLKAECIEIPEIREKMVKRAKKQRLSPLFILLDFYIREIDNSDAVLLVNQFEEDANMLGFSKYAEAWLPKTAWISDKIKEWRNNI